MCRWTSRPSFCASRRRPAARISRQSPCCRSWPISASRSTCRAPVGRIAARGFFPGLDHRQFRAARGGGVPAPRRRASSAAARRFIVGVDLVKDAQVLQKRLQRSQGVTAQFNLNLLARINRELGAKFDLGLLRASCLLQPRALAHRDASGQPQAAARQGVPASASTSAPARPSTPRTATSIRSSRSARWRAAPAGRRRAVWTDAGRRISASTR